MSHWAPRTIPTIKLSTNRKEVRRMYTELRNYETNNHFQGSNHQPSIDV